MDILPDGIIEDIREFFQIEDSHFEHFFPQTVQIEEFMIDLPNSSF